MTLWSAPLLASDVPGAGVEQFLRLVALVFGGLGLAGLVTGVASVYTRSSIFLFVVPPLLALVWMYLASHEYARHGNLGLVLLGMLPYGLCYGLARVVVKVIRRNMQSGRGG
ncbi:MAG: hypothetical protein ABWY06_13200 [Pseudomonas sp.]|uniref:hypothetical protein n=1 Tax=Pseudomonas sp. TaxID=306 RepID=UPI00339884CD